MTTGPKALKYRIRRAEGQDAAGPSAAARARVGAPRQAPRDDSRLFEQTDDGFDPALFPPVAGARDDARDGVREGAATPPVSGVAAGGADLLAPNEQTSEEEIETIRAEGLTGRQLRLARRVAKRHGIDAVSDFDAVRILRRRGIDPFDRAALFSLDGEATAQDAGADATARPGDDDMPDARRQPGSATTKALARIDGAGADTRVRLPQTTRAAPPPAAPLNEAQRAKEILRIQRDIAQRRRRKMALLAARLAFFVLLPTLIAGWYYFRVATPMFATKSEFVIQKAESASGGSAGGLGGLFSGTQFATNQDSITVQSFLQSRDAMIRLDRDLGFKSVFAQPNIDALQRLPDNASNEAAYKLYQKEVKIGYDPSEGVIRMEVIAPSAELSQKFSEALVGYAEEQVDKLTARMRDDQMKGARDSYADAEQKVDAAQAKVLDLQEKVGVLDPASETGLVMGQITTFQTQLQQKRLELNQLLDNAQPSEARVAGVRGDIARLEQLVAGLRKQLTDQGATQQTNESLAAVTGQLRIAEADLETRQALLATAAQSLEAARIEANKQVRYLEMGVKPVAPDEPTYPRAFEDTLLAFLVFSGIYLMLSLTASILREQVSS